MHHHRARVKFGVWECPDVHDKHDIALAFLLATFEDLLVEFQLDGALTFGIFGFVIMSLKALLVMI